MALPARTDDTAPSARRRMPRSRLGTTTSFQVGGTDVSVIANASEDGSLGEVFARFGKEGSTTAGLMDLLSIAISLGLQHGVPLQTFVAKFKDQRFEPMGLTDDPDIPDAASVGDYLARRLAHDWLDLEARTALDLLTPAEEAALPADTYAPTPLRRRATRAEATVGSE
jgi:hypothetical protein